MKDKREVPASLYTKEYYLTDNDGHEQYRLGVANHIHSKFWRALSFTDPKVGMKVLDLGCGRGEISFYAARRGCKVTAVDYSQAAVDLTLQTIGQLPPEAQSRVDVKKVDIADEASLREFVNQHCCFDWVYLVNFVEHLYPYQLERIFGALPSIMLPNGRVFISTPNGWYLRYFYTLKKLVLLPFTFVKIASRVLTGRMLLERFLSTVFKLSLKRNKLEDLMQVNVMSPLQIREVLKGWRISLKCDDHSFNLLSLLTRRWTGREMLIIARPSSKLHLKRVA
jgi:2-polyprenyl-3-methyl-5-hydroxy-6-metoxy-1,4-benzoquinol methylase